MFLDYCLLRLDANTKESQQLFLSHYSNFTLKFIFRNYSVWSTACKIFILFNIYRVGGGGGGGGDPHRTSVRCFINIRVHVIRNRGQ